MRFLFRASKFSQSLPGNKRASFQKIVRRVRDLLVLSGPISDTSSSPFEGEGRVRDPTHREQNASPNCEMASRK